MTKKTLKFLGFTERSNFFFLRGLGQFVDLRGAWQERRVGGGAFEERLIPQCTL